MPGFRPWRFWRDEQGAISIVAALSLFFLLALAAIVIDVGSLYYSRRNLQAVTDAAALAAVQNPANAMAVATDVFSRNGYSDETLNVVIGVYDADESLSAAARFTPGSSGVNAVRVRATRRQKTYLAGIFGLGNLSTLAVQSTAARLPTVSFGAGTRLASLDNGFANVLLGKMFGSSISLSLVDYNALLNTNIDALTFLNNLAVQANISGSYQQLAASNVTIGQVLAAAVATIDTSGGSSGNSTGALLALEYLQSHLAGTTPLQVSNIVDISSLSGRTIGNVAEVDGTGAQFNVMSLLSASARTVAAGQLIDLSSGLTIPGLSSATMKLAVGAPFAQVSNASVGVSIRTAQIRLAIIAKVLDGALGTVQLPIYLEAAYGQATVTALPCSVGGTLAEIAATSGAASVQFGTVTDAQLTDFSAPVTPAQASVIAIPVPLLGNIAINISGGANIASSGPETLPFTQADIDAGTIKSVPDSGTPFGVLGSSTVQLTPSILGIGLVNGLLGGLTSFVSSLLGQLDAPVGQLLTTLGIQLGIMDVRVFGASCRTPVLVG
jgi:uncharacterized membrane protein